MRVQAMTHNLLSMQNQKMSLSKRSFSKNFNQNKTPVAAIQTNFQAIPTKKAKMEVRLSQARKIQKATQTVTVSAALTNLLQQKSRWLV